MKLKSKEAVRSRLIITFLVSALFLSAFFSLFMGRYYIEPGKVFEIFAEIISGHAQKSPEMNVVWDIRFSRVLLNIIVGAGLAASGTAFQAIFQNRLVSPDILGVSNGAGFGAALALLLSRGAAVWVTGFAFGFGLISVFMTFLLAKTNRVSSPLTLVMSGIIVSSLFGAFISLIKLAADTESVLPAITYWLMGSFAGTTFEKVQIAALPLTAGLAVLFSMRWKMNMLSMGDEEAYTLGINPRLNRLIIIAASTVITASCVAVTGVIGWVGMILPNICREFISADNKTLLPASCLAGAVFMVLVDLIARSMTAAEIPIGILTAIVGTPVFAFIYRKGYGDGN
jgi:iron complex transport system permease protein